MKKLILLLAIASLTIAANWHIANQVIVIWSPVTTTVDGVPIPEAQITYKLYLKPVGTTIPQEMVSAIRETSYTITLPKEGVLYDIGIAAVRTIEAQIVEEGAVVWLTDFPDNPAGVIWYKKMAAITSVKLRP